MRQLCPPRSQSLSALSQSILANLAHIHIPVNGKGKVCACVVDVCGGGSTCGSVVSLLARCCVLADSGADAAVRHVQMAEGAPTFDKDKAKARARECADGGLRGRYVSKVEDAVTGILSNNLDRAKYPFAYEATVEVDEDEESERCAANMQLPQQQ